MTPFQGHKTVAKGQWMEIVLQRHTGSFSDMVQGF
jgi:hypothetical protein